MPAKKTESTTTITVFEKIVVPLVVAIITAATTYFVTTYEKAPPPQLSVALESMPAHIFAYAGNNGWSAFELYFDGNQRPTYAFKYTLPASEKDAYAGLTFKFEEGGDISGFESVEFLLTIPPNEEIDLIIKDISDKEMSYRLRGSDRGETKFDVPLSNFKNVNLKAVRDVMLFAYTGLSAGEHSVIIREVRFVK